METDNSNLLFRTRLKSLREEHAPALTQEMLGKAVGVSRGSISYYENGDRNPDIIVLRELAEYFNVTSDYLLGLTDDRRRKPSAVDTLGLSEIAVRNIAQLDVLGTVGDQVALTKIPTNKGSFVLTRFLENEHFFSAIDTIIGGITYMAHAKRRGQTEIPPHSRGVRITTNGNSTIDLYTAAKFSGMRAASDLTSAIDSIISSGSQDLIAWWESGALPNSTNADIRRIPVLEVKHAVDYMQSDEGKEAPPCPDEAHKETEPSGSDRTDAGKPDM